MVPTAVLSMCPVHARIAGVSEIRSRVPSLGLLFVLIASAIVGGLSLGQRDLWAPDEPKYALVAREMGETGEWLIPHLNGQPYPDKPPLMFWSIAAVGWLVGTIDQTAAVIPSLLAALITLLGTARLTRTVAPQTPAWVATLAAGMLAISFRFVMQATTGQLDMLLTAGTTWAFVALLEATRSADERLRQRWLIGAFAAMGLATLAKGPIGLILPIGGWLLGSRFAGERVPWRLLLRPIPWLAFAAVVGAWLIPAAVHAAGSGQTAWLSNILFKQTAVRYAASWHHNKPFWYFLTVPWYDFFPAALLLPAAIWGCRHSDPASSPAARRWLAGAFLFVLIFFSIPSGKRGLYLMPSYPLLAAWLALDLSWRLARAAASLLWIRVMALLLALLASIGAAAAAVLLPKQLLARQINLDTTWIALALTAIAAVAFVTTLARRPLGYLRYLAGGFALLYGALFVTAYPAIDPLKSASAFLSAVKQEVEDDAPGGMVDFRGQFGFYAGRLDTADPGDSPALDRLAARLSSDAPFWIVVDRDKLSSILRRLTAPACLVLERQLGDSRYVVVANGAATRPRRGNG